MQFLHSSSLHFAFFFLLRFLPTTHSSHFLHLHLLIKALEDAARFIAYLCAHNNNNADTLSSPPLDLPASPGSSPWVSFGGSYPGNLASWLKLKYPSLVVGTVGSSAPVFAEYDFIQYAEVKKMP